jgi:hypothetical protein
MGGVRSISNQDKIVDMPCLIDQAAEVEPRQGLAFVGVG